MLAQRGRVTPGGGLTARPLKTAGFRSARGARSPRSGWHRPPLRQKEDIFAHPTRSCPAARRSDTPPLPGNGVIHIARLPSTNPPRPSRPPARGADQPPRPGSGSGSVSRSVRSPRLRRQQLVSASGRCYIPTYASVSPSRQAASPLRTSGATSGLLPCLQIKGEERQTTSVSALPPHWSQATLRARGVV